MVYLIGLTGGIAAGKSTVAGRLREHGAIHIDADALAREAVNPGTPALARIVHRFGDTVLTGEGHLDRAALALRAFADDTSRKDLEAIVHPAVRDCVTARVAAAEREDPDAIIVYDVPLLVESGRGRDDFDLVVVAHADVTTRSERLVALRGMSPEEASARIEAQASETERLAVADVVIESGGALEDTLAAVDDLWSRLPIDRDAERG